MPELVWQKSSYSAGGEGECGELAASAPSHIHLREGDHPHEMATSTPSAFADLLRAVRAEILSR